MTDPEEVVSFQRSILENRIRRKPPSVREVEQQAAKHVMHSRAHNRLDDWRKPESYSNLLGQFRPAPHEKLDPLSQMRNVDACGTPVSMTKTMFSSPKPRAAQDQYQERRTECRTSVSNAVSSKRVQSHLKSPFYRSDSTKVSTGFTSRAEMLAARKRADHQRAQDTFGSPESMGFVDFSCGRKSMDTVIRNINNIAEPSKK